MYENTLMKGARCLCTRWENVTSSSFFDLTVHESLFYRHYLTLSAAKMFGFGFDDI